MNEERLTWLARQMQRDDRAAFREMVESGTRRLIAIAYRYTQDWDAAQDLTQETWIKVHAKIERFKPQRSFLPWLLRIHRNHCLSHLRRRGRERERAAEIQRALRPDGASRSPASVAGVPRRLPNPWENLREREFGRQLRDALRSLSPRQREVFSLVDIEQTDQQQAAGLLEMEYATLRTTLHFARRRLAQLLRRMEVRP